jgi:hypothetical protein
MMKTYLREFDFSISYINHLLINYLMTIIFFKKPFFKLTLSINNVSSTYFSIRYIKMILIKWLKIIS